MVRGRTRSSVAAAASALNAVEASAGTRVTGLIRRSGKHDAVRRDQGGGGTWQDNLECVLCEVAQDGEDPAGGSAGRWVHFGVPRQLLRADVKPDPEPGDLAASGLGGEDFGEHLSGPVGPGF